jgi:hypothetical protein
MSLSIATTSLPWIADLSLNSLACVWDKHTAYEYYHQSQTSSRLHDESAILLNNIVQVFPTT